MKSTTVIQNPGIDMRFFEKFENLNSTVIPRSFILALIIGSVLNLINQYDAFFAFKAIEILPLLLTYITPFVVVMYSQRTSFNKAWLNINNQQAPFEVNGLFSTSLSHGIPAKALVIGLIVGSINSALLLLESYFGTESFSALPLRQMAQFYFIPMIFGMLTQTISYRRAITIFTN